MSRNPFFTKALDEMEALHDRKNHDYASDANPYSNFEFAATFAGVTVDQVFAVMEGIKQARILELTAHGKAPNNESLRDSILDGAVYPALRLSYYDWAAEGRPPMSVPSDDTQLALALADLGPNATPDFLATLDAIDRTVGRTILNPHRVVHDTKGVTPQNPITDVADFHTEGD